MLSQAANALIDIVYGSFEPRNALLCVDPVCVLFISLFFFNQECFLRCSGYGDLWDDIQNLPENDKGSSVHGLRVSSEEAGGSRENSEIGRKSGDWKSEEEENGNEEDNEDEEQDEKGTIRIMCRD